MGKVKTRCEINCPLLGAPAKIPTNVLPTIKDVIRHLLLTAKKNLQQKPDKKNVAKILEDVWIKASIPMVSQFRIIQMMDTYLTTRKALLKVNKKKTTESAQLKAKQFVESCDLIFDIATCKCQHFDKCVCKREDKVILYSSR